MNGFSWNSSCNHLDSTKLGFKMIWRIIIIIILSPPNSLTGGYGGFTKKRSHMWLNYCVSCSLEFTQWNQAKRMHNAGKWKHRFFCFLRVELHQPSTWKAGTSSGQKKRPCNADTVPAMLSPSHLYNCHRSVTWDVVWLIHLLRALLHLRDYTNFWTTKSRSHGTA